MAVVRCSAAISSITLVTSGVTATTAVTDGTAEGGSAVFTCTAAEATGLCGGANGSFSPGGAGVFVSDTSNLTTGTVDVKIRAHITNSVISDSPVVQALTINSHVYTLSNITAPNVRAVDAKALLDYGFKLVTG